MNLCHDVSPPKGPEVDLGVPPAVQSAREEVFEKVVFFWGEEKMASDGKLGNMSRFFLDVFFVGQKSASDCMGDGRFSL